MNPENEPRKKTGENETSDKPLPKDDPSRDEHHDESRRNAFDPEVARGLGSAPDKDQ